MIGKEAVYDPLQVAKKFGKKHTIYIMSQFKKWTETPLQRTFVSLQEIWYECFGLNLSKMERRDAFMIKSIMAKMEGWESKGERKRLGAEYGMQRVYSRARQF